MEKNNLAFIWEGRGGSNETENSFARVLRRNWCKRNGWGGQRGPGALVESWGVCGCLYPHLVSVRRRVSHAPTVPRPVSLAIEGLG